MTAEQDRRDRSFELRVAAAEQAKNVTYNYRAIDPIKGQQLPQPVIHRANGEENLMGLPLSFTKGLPHNKKSGLAEARADFDQMVEGIDSGKGIDYRRTPLGPAADINNPQAPTREKDWASQRARDLLAAVRATNKSGDIVRAWEASSAGLAFEINGPDAQAVTMPPAPALGSDELTAEIAEVYLQAAARDVPFGKFKNNKIIDHAVKNLNKLPYFQTFQRQFVDSPGNVPITTDNIFRGVFRGDLIGPYLSQFMIIGNNGLNTNRSRPEFSVDDGFIAYGSINIDQRIRIAVPGVNYMTSFEEWLDVQNGADFRGEELYQDKPKRRFMTTPRDLATYVHYDALYEAYLNACLILLGAGAAFDPGVPYQQPDNVDHQQGFALYGGPHILTLVTEVATRALKAVRYQKFNIHRRCRPEVLAARMERLKQIRKGVDATTFARFEQMDRDLQNAGVYDTLNSVCPDTGKLLPMAFVEGSPMHPAYGAGHATVAGACTTILKAWFDTTLKFDYVKGNFNQGPEPTFVRFVRDPSNPMMAFEPAGQKLKLVKSNGDLTIEGELNKIAANISIGRDWAGVHYYTDYTQSMIMGEEIAINMLQEQSITYNDEDNLSFTLFKFDGSVIRIENGQIIPVAN